MQGRYPRVSFYFFTQDVIQMTAKEIVQQLTNKHGTCDPFALADALNIIVLYHPLGGTLGFSTYDRRNKFIVINDQADDEIRPYICAHELGHSIMHENINLPFLRQNTLFSISKYERQADTFAVELLMPDTVCAEHPTLTLEQIGQMCGIPLPIIKLKTLP